MAPLDRPSHYINREVSWLDFNRRVLEEAEDERNPLLERVKFLAITANNLDEFFEIRLAGLLQQIEDGAGEPGPDGLSPAETRDRIVPLLHALTAAQYRCWNQKLRPQLTLERVRTLAVEELSPAQRRFAVAYCVRELDPLLTPITVDPAHPFPRVLNKSLCLAFLLRRKRGRRSGASARLSLGVVTVPRALPRLIRLPGVEGGDDHDFIYLAHLVAWHARAMYRGFVIEAMAAFRVTRNSNLYLQEEEARNLLETVRLELHNRRKGNAVRLELEAGADPEIAERLRVNFELEPWQVFSTAGPVNLSRLATLYDQTARPDLKYRPFQPPVVAPAPEPVERSVGSGLQGPQADASISGAPGRKPGWGPRPFAIFAQLRAADRLLHHPYDGYGGVIAFLQAAAADPRVLSIKQTLYRTSEDSPILQALIAAAARKEVAVIVELQARFDEAVNIAWARHLEDAGVQVSYGAVGRKTHGKMALVVRHDEDGEMRRYLHLGTGNYNHRTARLYTDFSLLTARPDFGAAVHAVFGYLTADAEAPGPAGYEPLLVAPFHLSAALLELVAREAEHARRGRPSGIIIKVNGLLDHRLIQALYAASRAGVETDLLVRGVCALRPQVRGLSRLIRVRSLIGRFLEHSRIFHFVNGGDEQTFLGSADWMPRNLYERVEVVFPVLDAALRHRLRHEVLAAYLADTANTRWLGPSGDYRRPRRRRFSAQEFFMARSLGAATLDDIPPPVSGPGKQS